MNENFARVPTFFTFSSNALKSVLLFPVISKLSTWEKKLSQTRAILEYRTKEDALEQNRRSLEEDSKYLSAKFGLF